MQFRPCIDIHNGKVKQIVGGSLRDSGDFAKENFVSDMGAADYARLYERMGIRGGHIILLNAADSPYYEATKQQALEALRVYPGGLQVGGGINPGNAEEFLEAGASHVIVTSYVFRNGEVSMERLMQMVKAVGKEHLVLDLSCRKRDGVYYIVTDRWQTFTDVAVTKELLEELSRYCDEYLIHAVDVEGKASGIEGELVTLLAEWNGIPITYAGGIGSYEHLAQIRTLGEDKINITIGSALDIFGGTMKLTDILACCE